MIWQWYNEIKEQYNGKSKSIGEFKERDLS